MSMDTPGKAGKPLFTFIVKCDDMGVEDATKMDRYFSFNLCSNMDIWGEMFSLEPRQVDCGCHSSCQKQRSASTDYEFVVSIIDVRTTTKNSSRRRHGDSLMRLRYHSVS